jgi:hypothetical protein
MKNKTTSSELGRCEALVFDDRHARTFFGVFDGRFVCGSYLLRRVFGRKSTGNCFKLKRSR